jgi:hypothetical protein
MAHRRSARIAEKIGTVGGVTTQQLSDQPLSLEGVAASRTEVVSEAIAIIDGALTQMFQRELVSSSEVTNLLLDVRSLLATKN